MCALSIKTIVSHHRNVLADCDLRLFVVKYASSSSDSGSVIGVWDRLMLRLLPPLLLLALSLLLPMLLLTLMRLLWLMLLMLLLRLKLRDVLSDGVGE